MPVRREVKLSDIQWLDRPRRVRLHRRAGSLVAFDHRDMLEARSLDTQGQAACSRKQFDTSGHLRRQVRAGELLALEATHHPAHLVDGVEASLVVATLELAHVAVQVLVAHLVVRAVEPALHE